MYTEDQGKMIFLPSPCLYIFGKTKQNKQAHHAQVFWHLFTGTGEGMGPQEKVQMRSLTGLCSAEGKVDAELRQRRKSGFYLLWC